MVLLFPLEAFPSPADCLQEDPEALVQVVVHQTFPLDSLLISRSVKLAGLLDLVVPLVHPPLFHLDSPRALSLPMVHVQRERALRAFVHQGAQRDPQVHLRPMLRLSTRLLLPAADFLPIFPDHQGRCHQALCRPMVPALPVSAHREPDHQVSDPRAVLNDHLVAHPPV